MLVLLTAAALTYVTVPVVRWWAVRHNVMAEIRDRDVHDVPIPRLGGLAMFVGFAAGMLLASKLPLLSEVFAESRDAIAVISGATLIVLVGAGGERYAAAHAENTASLVSRLPLDSGDVIYLSELIDVPGSTYSALASVAGIAPISPEEIDRRMAELRAALRAGSPGLVVSYYDIREFMY